MPNPRRVYVLHAGMFDHDNAQTTRLRDELIRAGIPAGDIIMLDNPMPQLPGNLNNRCLDGLNGRMAADAFIAARDNFSTYRAYANPDSPVVARQAQALQRQLAARGLGANDQVVWVGHSAGGQLGMTMSARFARDNTLPQFQTVVTLGSPIQTFNAPANVRVLNFVSDGDEVLMNTVPAAGVAGVPLYIENQGAGGNDATMYFPGIEHAGCPGRDWLDNPAVIAKLHQVITYTGNGPGMPAAMLNSHPVPPAAAANFTNARRINQAGQVVGLQVRAAETVYTTVTPPVVQAVAPIVVDGVLREGGRQFDRAVDTARAVDAVARPVVRQAAPVIIQAAPVLLAPVAPIGAGRWLGQQLGLW